jgi:CRISPR-associated protein Cmr6
MPAAVPQYVGTDFADCPPGHRFGLYFPVWRDDWSLDREGKGAALKQTLKLPSHAGETLEALRRRQTLLLDAVPKEARLSITAQSTAPFATGLGMEHPLENGFAFLNPYGLPYLPGSSIKGVLRRAAQDLAGEASNEDRKGWSEQAITALFGLESEDRSKEHSRGALTFWDALPNPAKGSLGMEVMTPHYGDYYKGESLPHDAGQPNPIVFLVVPPGSEFTFHITCDAARLPQDLTASWQTLMRAALEHAFEWLGFGAKTAVGYGAMAIDEAAMAQAEKERDERSAEAERRRAAAEQQARLASLSPNLCRIEEFKEHARARFEQLRGGKDRPNTHLHTEAQQLVITALEGEDWTAEEKRALAEAIEAWLPELVERFDRKDDWKEARRKLKLAVLKGEA